MTISSAQEEIVIRGGGAPAASLARLVEDATRSVPPGVDVTVLRTGVLHLSKHAVRRVRVVDVEGEAGADQYVRRTVARPHDVVVLCGGLRVSGDWYAEVIRRLRARPDRPAMMRLGDLYLVAAPQSVTSIGSVDLLWPTIPGVVPAVDDGRGLRDEDITAVIIAKDEAPVIEACIAAARPFVGETVVYDTGSSDGTQAAAARAGARVVQGYWDDDFAGARNRALEHASTDWVLIVDADDVAVGDPVALRVYLNAAGTDVVDGPQVAVGAQGVESGVVVNTPRFFRRSRYHFRGTVHENLAPRSSEDVRSHGDCSHVVRFLHSGHSEEAILRGGKAQRNLALARTALASSTPGTEHHARCLGEVGRALAMAGQEDEALHLLDVALSQTSSPHLVVTCGRLAASLLVARRRDDDLARWITALERAGECRGRVALFRAQLLMMRGDLNSALAEVRPFADGSRTSTDLWGVPNPRDDAQRLRIALEHDTGDQEAARTSLLGFLGQKGGGVPLPLLLVVLRGRPAELLTAAAVADDTYRRLSVLEALEGDPHRTLPWIAALRAAHPDDADVLEAGCRLSSSAGWQEALQWTVEAVGAGAEHRPLHDLTSRETAPLVDRCMALAWLSEGGQNGPAVRELFGVLEPAAPEERMEVLSAIELHLPGLLDHLTARSA